MTHAYTPGLRVTNKTRLVRERVLPLKGEVLVTEGQFVHSSDIIAKTELPGAITSINVINPLGIEPEEIRDYMKKKEGEKFEKGEILAENKPFLGISLFKTVIRAPFDGVVESISEVTGQLLLREPPQPVQVHAYIDGMVTQILPEEGAIIETCATFIQGILGIGGEVWGELILAVDSPEQELHPNLITSQHEGKLLVGGSLLRRPAFEKAKSVGVKGIIVGGFHDQDLRDILGYDLGVAITGHEEVGLTLVITEGFGEIPMARKTFELLRQRAGAKASLSGATQIRAGVIRPEIIIPYPQEHWDLESREKEEIAQAVNVGDPIRVIREPYFGKLGRVLELIPALQQVESESRVRVLRVEFENGSTAVVPRANIERIEE